MSRESVRYAAAVAALVALWFGTQQPRVAPAAEAPVVQVPSSPSTPHQDLDPTCSGGPKVLRPVYPGMIGVWRYRFCA